MSKRYFRKALVLAVAGVLASPAIAGVVNAQTTPIEVNPQKTVTASAAFVGPIPSGVTGVSVTVSCKNTFLAGTTTPSAVPVTYTASIPTSGGSAFMNFNLTATAPGSSCVVTAATAGTANLDKGSISITVGGTVRASTATVTTAAPGSNSAVTGDIAVQVSTTVLITVSYPQITVKKVIVGDEPVAGFAYPMTIGCSNVVTTSAFIDTTGKARVNGANTWLDISGPLTFTQFPYPSGPVAGPFTITAANHLYVFDAALTSFAGPTILGTDLAFGAGTYSITLDANNAQVLNYFGTIQSFTFTPASTAIILAAMNAAKFTTTTTLSPVGVVNGVLVFNGSFTLTGAGATNTKSFGINDFPGLTNNSVCEVTETNNQGGATSYSSSVTNADGTAGTALPGVQTTATVVNGVTIPAVFKSSLTKMNQTVTVTNAWYGDLIVSKVVTGDPKTNIATYQISVACDKGGPKDTFLLKDRQSKLYNNIAVGTNCLITETLSDGAVASYNDNSGDNTTDGRVTIKARGTGCAAPGSPTNSAPGGPSPVTSFNDCMANVIITNDYNPPVTTTAAAAPATTAAPAAPATTAAPAVVAEPAQAVEDTPTFTG
jgi:hypothetical protein